MAFNGVITGVPVFMDSVQVGKAEISGDGTVYIRFDREKEEYAQLMAKLLNFGLVDGISLATNAIPAEDRSAPN